MMAWDSRGLGRWALPGAMLLLDLGWIVPACWLLGRWLEPGHDRALLPPLAVLVVLAGGQVAVRLARARRWRLGRARAAVAGLGLALVLLVVALDRGPLALAAWAAGGVWERPTPVVLALFAGLGLWWRGLSLGRDAVMVDTVIASLRVGLVALVACFLLALGTDAETAEWLTSRAGWAVLGFLVGGLLSLSLARLAEVETRQATRVGDADAFQRHWLATLGSVVAVVVLVALGLAQLVSFDLIGAAVGPVLGLVGTVLWWVIMALLLPVGMALEAVILFLRQFIRPGEPREISPAGAGWLERVQQEASQPWHVPPEVVAVLQGAGLLLALAVGGLLLARAVFWWRPTATDDGVPEERDSVWGGGSPWALLLAWLRRRLTRPPDLAPPPPGPRATIEPAADGEALTVRQTYRRLLGLGAALGAPRAPTATADEHLPRLQARLAPAGDLAWLTALYVRARYGPTPPSAAEAAEAARRWRRVEEATRQATDAEAPGTAAGEAQG